MTNSMRYYKGQLKNLGKPDQYGASMEIRANGRGTNYMAINTESLAAFISWAEKVIPGAKKRAAAKKAGAAVRALQHAEAKRQIEELRAALADITARAAVEMDQSCTARGLVNCDILARSRAALENNKGII